MQTLRMLALTSVLGASLLPPHCAGQTRFKTIYQFGAYPDAQTPTGLVAGPQGVYYGASAAGGIYGYGTVFQLTPPSVPGGSWTETVLYSFAPQDGDGTVVGATPSVGANGTIYGTSMFPGYGTVWQLQPPGTEGGSWTDTVLLNTSHSGDIQYLSNAIAGPNGVVYALAETGTYFHGTVIQLTPPAIPGGEWAVAQIYAFTGGADGGGPFGLIVNSKGVLYGTTMSGGSGNFGTVFELTPPATAGAAWTENVIYNFGDDDNGCEPTASPVMDGDGNLYGTASRCGSAESGTVWELQRPATPDGAWTLTVLYTFQTVSNGLVSTSPLIVRGGTIYGALAGDVGTALRGGSIFELQKPATPGQPWTQTILHLFTSDAEPFGGLALDRGAVIGTTNHGDPIPGYPFPPTGIGTVFSVQGIEGGN